MDGRMKRSDTCWWDQLQIQAFLYRYSESHCIFSSRPGRVKHKFFSSHLYTCAKESYRKITGSSSCVAIAQACARAIEVSFEN